MCVLMGFLVFWPFSFHQFWQNCAWMAESVISNHFDHRCVFFAFFPTHKAGVKVLCDELSPLSLHTILFAPHTHKMRFTSQCWVSCATHSCSPRTRCRWYFFPALFRCACLCNVVFWIQKIQVSLRCFFSNLLLLCKQGLVKVMG